MLAAGDLDTTFNPGGPIPGVLVSDLGFVSHDGQAIAVQADGKTLMAGTVRPGTLTTQLFGVARYNVDGSLDTTFGVGGVDGVDGLAVVDFDSLFTAGVGTGTSRSSMLEDLAIDPITGKIILVGLARDSSNNRGVGVARLNADGTLDTTFGTGGKTLTVISPTAIPAPQSVALQSDGKIVVGGSLTTGTSTFVSDFFVVRYTTSGVLDTGTFGSGAGWVATDMLGTTDDGTSVVIQDDGKIVVGGRASHPTLNFRFALARYNPDGSLDTSFGDLANDGILNSNGGRVWTDIFGPQIPGGTSGDVISALAIQSDGKIVAAGSSTGPSTDLVLARYDIDGSLDPTFNDTFPSSQAGTVRIFLPEDEIAEALTIQPDGKIIVAGLALTAFTDQALVMRLLPSGLLDPSFASGGVKYVDIVSGNTGERLRDVAIQPDGKIIAGGSLGLSASADFLLIRYESGISTDSISGDHDVDEGATYTLTLAASDPTITQWEINWGDGIEIVAGNPSSWDHVYADGDANYTISASFTNSSGTTPIDNTVAVMVHNVAPTLMISGDADVDEGDVYTLDLESIDPGDDTITQWEINWGDSVEIVTGNPSSWDHVYADGDANYTITATATDEDGTFAAVAAVLVMVHNVAPTLTISGDADVDEGDVYTLTLGSLDPGNDTITQWEINWGDSVEIVSGNPTSWDHVYADGDANYTITATATDEDGTYSSNSISVDVLNVAPTANDATFSLLENSPNGTVVGTVAATDPGDDSLSFNIAGGTGAAAFSIDSMTGEITVTNSALLDYETTPALTLEIEVDDGDGGIDAALVTINLINLASISGVVFVDVNQNGLFDANEPGIDGVTILLLDEFGDAVLDEFGDPIAASTSDGGFYLFEDLDPGVYQLFEMQPTGVNDGQEQLGSLGGTIVGNDRMQLTLADINAFDYAFAEIGQQVTSGDAAGIGFWQNKHGQALITQGGTQLAAWLTTNFSNIFGNELAGASGSDVATFYRDQLFKQKSNKSAGPAKVDAQFMAVALATYFTSSNLAGTVATSYGFHVTNTGIGTRVVNVGNKGAAFSVANGTDLTILQLLSATNDLTDQPDLLLGFAAIYDADGDGNISSTEAALRTLANDIYSLINEGGGI